ncbi:MAG: phage baseplate assembly protein V [Acidimicrobiales bacterium]
MSGPDPCRARHFGLYPAVVVDLVDPDDLGRVEVRLPSLGLTGDEDVRAWATVLSPYADDDQGFLALPEVGSQVVVGFEAGDPRRPYMVGAAWNGREAPPATAAAANDIRVLKSRSGSVLRFDDGDPGAVVTLATAAGHTLTLNAATDTVEVAHANGCRLTITAAGAVEIQATNTVEVTAAALNVHAATATFDGLVNCTTLIASSAVVSPSYTPGAGNVW